MSKVNYDKLRKLAMKATKGDWWLYYEVFRPQFSAHKIIEVQCQEKVPIVSWPGFDDCTRSKSQHRNNAAFIAAANPECVMSLIDEITRLQKELARAKAEKAGAW